MATQEFLAELEIKSLVIRERYYRDTLQWKNLRATWHPDSSKTKVNISWYNGDVDGFITGSEAMTKGGTNAIHTICPVEVHINGDKALAESTGNIQIRLRYQDSEFDCISYARFISRLEKVNNSWKLLSLETIYDRDTIIPIAPSAQPVTIPVDNRGNRESYKCLTWLLAQRGFRVNQDLPGMDNPASAAALISEGFAWLED